MAVVETDRDESSAATAGLFSGFRVVSLCTLGSRILGLVRDVGMASLFGNGALLDAFTVAFRIPNLARRMFGEGALTAAFLPAFVREMEQSGQEQAWKLANALLIWLAVLLGAIVVAGELLILVLHNAADTPESRTLLELTAIMLPYLWLICLAAQISAMLNALRHFFWPAVSPMLLNVVWMIGIWGLAPLLDDGVAQMYLISLCVAVAGVLQLGCLLPRLRGYGFRYDPDWRSMSARVREIGRAMLPVVVGLSVTQFNTLLDSLIAWGFSAPEDPAAAIPGKRYLVESGTAAALYLGQRLYQFPLGFFGVALSTVMFPLLSRHAEQGRLDRLRDDLLLGLKLTLAIGVPASAGLVLLAEPMTRLMFQRGAFDAADAQQTSAMIAAYGLGVWAFSALLIVHRGYYAAGDAVTPLRIGLGSLVLNLAVNVLLMWLLGGVGLALATALVAMCQTAVAAWFIQERIGRLDWRSLGASGLRCAAATGVMSASCRGVLLVIDSSNWPDSTAVRAARLVLPVVAGLGSYAIAARLLGIRELWLLFCRDAAAEEH